MPGVKPVATTPMANIIPSGGHNEESVPRVDLLQIEKRYGEEREKRLRDDAND
jgi:hypothetical protein